MTTYPQLDAHVQLYLALFGPRQRSMWTCPSCGQSMRHMDRTNRDGRGHLAKHCGCAILPSRRMTPDQLAAHKQQVKIELQRKYRREAAEKAGRILMLRVKFRRLHDAHVSAFKDYIKALQDAPKHLHDAHVKRYIYVISSRSRAAKRYASNPQEQRERQTKRRLALLDSYVIQHIKAMGIPKDAITPRLISMKREAIEYLRLSRTIKTNVKNHLKEVNEAITKHT